MAWGAIASAAAGIIGSIVNAYQQHKQYEYQKDLQETIFEREDNAVQRRRADLIAAGMSPTLAAGDAAQAGPVVPVKTPSYGDIGLETMGALRVAAEIQQSQASTELAKHQAHKTDIDALKAIAETEESLARREKTIMDTQRSAVSINELKVKIDQMVHDLKVTKDTGVHSNPSLPGKILRDIVGAFEHQIVPIKKNKETKK